MPTVVPTTSPSASPSPAASGPSSPVASPSPADGRGPIQLGEADVDDAEGRTYADEIVDVLRPRELAARPPRDQLAFGVAESWLKLSSDGNGGFTARDAAGAVRYRIRPPNVRDASGRSGTTTLTARKAAVVIQLDPSFLDGARYPLTLEPAAIEVPSTAPQGNASPAPGAGRGVPEAMIGDVTSLMKLSLLSMTSSDGIWMCIIVGPL
jgi:hypothetical protein